mgnify:CR=1 FL=1
MSTNITDDWVFTLTNKTVNWVTLTAAWSATKSLKENWLYLEDAWGGWDTLPLTNIATWRTGNWEFYAFVEKTDYCYARTANWTVERYKKQAGQLILANDNVSTTNWDNTVWYYGMASLSLADDYWYFTDSTNNVIKRFTISTKTTTSMTMSGTTGFLTYGSITTDGTDLYVLQNNSTNMYKYSVSWTTATYISTTTLPFIINSTSSSGYSPLVNGVNLFYMSDSRIVKCNIDGTADYNIIVWLLNSNWYAYGLRWVFFEWNWYIMYWYARYDTEDYVGVWLQIIENNN